MTGRKYGRKYGREEVLLLVFVEEEVRP